MNEEEKPEQQTISSIKDEVMVIMKTFSEQFERLVQKIDTKIQINEEKEKRLVELENKMSGYINGASSKIVLDVGGTKFATSKSTLLSQKGSFFEAMLGTGKWKPDDDGSYFIDRNPKHFSVILDFLRKGKVVMNFNELAIEELRDELDFYQITFPEAIFPKSAFSESTLLTKTQMQELHCWLGGDITTTLLYTATRDGFQGAKFHAACDNKGATVVLVRSTEGYLFGGYASQPWESSSVGFKAAADCFLFTLTNPHNLPPTKYELVEPARAMCKHATGPVFGGGYDLIVNSNSNVATNSRSEFPCSYKDTTGKGKETFTGSRNFQTNEIEVFLVQ